MFHKDGLRRPEIYAGVIEEEAQKEWEHTLLQDSMDKELHELNKRLEQKEHLEFLRMVRVSVLNDALKSMYIAEKRGKRQVMIRLSSKVIIKFRMVLQKHVGAAVSGLGAEIRAETVFLFAEIGAEMGGSGSGKTVVELNGRLNKCGVISPQFDVGVKEIEPWTARLLPSRQFGYIVLTTSASIMDHEEARRNRSKIPCLAVAKNLRKPSQAPRGVPVGLKFEKLIMDGKVTLMDDEGEHVKNVDYPSDHDSEDEVASVDNDMARSMALEKVGFGTNSLLEQWTDTYENDDYDYYLYNDDMYEGQKIPDKIQAIYDNLDIKVRGRKKK
nr:40S ribosomal protein S15a [Tanacetum cinerariifolium]